MKTNNFSGKNTGNNRIERFFGSCRKFLFSSLTQEAQALLESHRNRAYDYPFNINSGLVGYPNGVWKC